MISWEDARSFLEAVGAGLAGAIVSLPFHAETTSFVAKAVMVMSGTTMAYYVAPWAIDALQVKPAVGSSISFLIGAFGMSVMSAVMRAIAKADLWSFISKRFGGGPTQ